MIIRKIGNLEQTRVFPNSCAFSKGENGLFVSKIKEWYVNIVFVIICNQSMALKTPVHAGLASNPGAICFVIQFFA